jgi:hypothetical protein
LRILRSANRLAEFFGILAAVFVGVLAGGVMTASMMHEWKLPAAVDKALLAVVLVAGGIYMIAVAARLVILIVPVLKRSDRVVAD